MKRIVILGASGAGKSTLARELSSILGIKVYHLDSLFWRSGWTKKDRETRIDILQNLVWEKQWIIEGNYPNLSDFYLPVADTIIFTDLSTFRCLLRIIRRHYRGNGHTRRDIPRGCTDRLTVQQMVKVTVFPLNERRVINQKLRFCKSKRIFRLRTNNEVDDFLARLELITNKKRKAYRTTRIIKKRTG